jgi:hypothetical protein
MSDREREGEMDSAVDPPENQPGGNIRVDSTDEEAAAVDPPENQPGGGQA